MVVPVVDSDQHPLMPTTPARARRWIRSGKATAFWKGGIFCVRLNVEPSARQTQPVIVGIDPGSKKEGYSVVSAAHTYLNIQADARTGVQEAEQQSTRMRRTRRYRKTPYRKMRPNRHQSKKKLRLGHAGSGNCASPRFCVRYSQSQASWWRISKPRRAPAAGARGPTPFPLWKWASCGSTTPYTS
jgi:hypothetical protein